MSVAISVQRLSKQYRLGETHQLSIRDLVNGAAARLTRVDTWSKPFSRKKNAPPEKQPSDFWALRDVSFEVHSGEVLGIIGRNGAGKSTLLKILSRIATPTRGRVELEGRVASLLEIGTGFHPELTGRENVYLNGAILGLTRSEVKRRFDQIVDFAEVDQFIDTPVKRYSSGMYMRLAFAVAAHLECEILIVDEVLAVGDTEFQKKCMNALGHAGSIGRTVLFVSHQLSAIRRLCDRVIVLRNGAVAFDGETSLGLQEYLNPNEHTDTASVVEDLNEKQFVQSLAILVNGAPSRTVYFGDCLEFIAEMRCPAGTRSPSIGFVIADQNGTPVINANNTYQPMVPLREPTVECQLRCRLGSVPLMPGRYFVSFWVGDRHGTEDFADRALFFDVFAKDIWGTAKTPPGNCSLLWWPCEFHVLGLQEDAFPSEAIRNQPR